MTISKMGPQIAVSLIALTFALAISAAPAHAEEGLSPWWHLSTQSRPAYLQPGKARDEVQRFAAGGALDVLEDRGAGLYGASYGELDKEQGVGLTGGETPEEVQKALEGMYGTGNVEVTSTPPFEVYEAKFVGKLADQPVERMRYYCLEAYCPQVTQVVEGRPDGEIVVNATNLGDAAVDPVTHPVTITDRLPKGLVAVGIYGSVGQVLKYWEFGECSLKTVSCTFATQPTRGGENVHPYHQLQVLVAVNVKEGAKSGEVNEARIVGGGAPSATARSPLTVSGSPVPFGVDAYEIRAEEVGGKPDTQAGSHPFQLTTTLNFNEVLTDRTYLNDESVPLLSGPAAGSAKDLYFKLPAGLIGNPTVIPTCPLGTFLFSEGKACPRDTVVGVAAPNIFLGEKLTYEGPIEKPLYNVEPAVGEPARFGFGVYGDTVLLDTSVRTGSDYGVTVSATNITQTAEFLGAEVTLWGVPADPRHNNQRCYQTLEGYGSCAALGLRESPPFVSLPTACTGPMATSVEGDAWSQKAQSDFEHVPLMAGPLASFEMGALDGCDRLPFSSSLSAHRMCRRGAPHRG